MWAKKLYKSAKTLRSLSLWPRLEPDLQNKVIKAMCKLTLMPPSTGATSVQLMGYRIRFPDKAMLEFLFDEIFVEAVYLFHSDTEHPTIIDCGSNIGMSILFFKALYPNARVIGFEPDPFTFKILSENIALNGLSDVELHQCALSHVDGPLQFYRPADLEHSTLQMNAIRPRQGNDKCITVDGRRLSHFIGEVEIDLLKLDIEGTEVNVLSEIADADKLRNVKCIHFEYTLHTNADRDDLSLVLRLLERNGFGYQLWASKPAWPSERARQNILFYCYRKHEFHSVTHDRSSHITCA
jgi:FkbM family methyltransferase